MGINETKLTDKEAQEKISKIGKPFSKLLTNNIVDATLKNLESENFKLDEEHKTKITAALSESLEKISFSELSTNKTEIINNLTKDLKEKQTMVSKAAHALPGKSSYHISTENVKKIANNIGKKYQENKPPESAIIKSTPPVTSKNEEQSNSKKKSFIKEKVSHMKDTFGKAVIATKNINQLRTTLSKSVKVNKDQDRGR
ncbi:hypothetical protein A3306_06605 [Rickettsia bellii]|nr:DUF5410 family protein [Rickettsia bellii]ARD86793.1 hypothetical protein A3306_06605 [Rickettsia bellii]KJV89508.1 hypothetical protein RBEAN4_0486 [Rickettsia bellii str. RML An4]